MLRTFVLVAAALFLTAALVGVAIDPATWPSAVVAAVLVAGIAFERARYGALQQKPSAGGTWRETPERFVDDASGKPVSVWFDPVSGERRYVAIEDDPAL